MTQTQTRFPRMAYARRAEDLAAELDAWVLGYGEYLADHNSFNWTDAHVERAESRRSALTDIAKRLYEVAADLALLS